ncbi:MAG: hypothetical protein IPP88_17325 [Betaproteobacteria bacterium]|nr:hypothetical protein [Betaproteobacteria bacterium]
MSPATRARSLIIDDADPQLRAAAYLLPPRDVPMSPVSAPPPTTEHEMLANSATLRLVLLYALFAGLWIMFSDNFVGWLFRDPVDIVMASTAKGWLFVAVTSIFLFGLVRRLLNQALTLARREQAAQAENIREPSDCSTLSSMRRPTPFLPKIWRAVTW